MSNAVAVDLIRHRPPAQFAGLTITAPPSIWLTFAASYVGAADDTPSAPLGELSRYLGYTARPSKDRMAQDASTLRAQAGTSLRMWLKPNVQLESGVRSQLERFGVSISVGSDVRTWGVQATSRIRNLDDSISPFNTAAVTTMVADELTFPDPFRDESFQNPPVLPTVHGGERYLPGRTIAHYEGTDGLSGIRLQSGERTFYLLTASEQDRLDAFLDRFSIQEWSTMKASFTPGVGRVVDGFLTNSAFAFERVPGMSGVRLWNGAPDALVQHGAVKVDTDRVALSAWTLFTTSQCCGDLQLDQRRQARFQFSTIAPTFFVEEDATGLIRFVGYTVHP